MFVKYERYTEEGITAFREDGSAEFIEPSDPRWSDVESEAGPYVDNSAEKALARERQSMSCTPLQGILTLGETEWQKVLDYRETATWAEKIIIDSAQDWKRTSENIAFFGYLLGYDDEQMDTLFRQAKGVVA